MKNHFIKLFQYENWANKEIAETMLGIESLPDKPLSLMSHIINARIIWLSRIKNEVSDLAVWKVYNKSEIADELIKSSSALTDFISSLPEDDFKKSIHYKNTKGENFNSALEDILIHMTHHSAYHRGQIVLLIKNLVTTLPYTDYIHFIRNVKS